ncbi:hypothetical protein [Lysobacter sp. TY2-98]|nr:hypothetical protein [Lysobacter sp. TY2-98]
MADHDHTDAAVRIIVDGRARRLRGFTYRIEVDIDAEAVRAAPT